MHTGHKHYDYHHSQLIEYHVPISMSAYCHMTEQYVLKELKMHESQAPPTQPRSLATPSSHWLCSYQHSLYHVPLYLPEL